MKKILFLIISITGLINCTNNNETDCSLFDPVFPSLHVKIIDFTDENLITSGTYNSENISVEGDFSNAGFLFIADNENISELDNSLYLSIPNELTSKYTIHLNDSETIYINFKNEEVEIPCDITYYKPIEAEFNAKKIELIEYEPLQFYIVVEL